MTPNDWDREEQSALEPFEGELRALRDRHAGDPPIEVLQAAHADALPPDLQASTLAHLESSRWSRALVDGANDAGGELSAADQARLLERITRESRAGQQRPGVQPRIWWAMLATGSLAAVAFVMVQRSGQPTAAPPAVVTPAIVPAPVAPTFALTLDKAVVKLSPRAFTYRGDVSVGDFVSQLKPALDAYRQDEYQRADDAFTALAKQYPQAVEIPFYQGISRLFLNDISGADTSLAAADQLDRSADLSFGPDITWYRAIVDERLGRTDDARAKLASLCRQVHARQTHACEAAERLK